MPEYTTETRTYVGFKDLRIGQRYTGVPQDNGTVLVSAAGAPMDTGVKVSSEEWGSDLLDRFLTLYISNLLVILLQ